MTLISFGEGISFSVMYRFALMSSNVSKGTVAAAVSMLLMLSFFVVIEAVRWLYTQFHLIAFSGSCVLLLSLWFFYPRKVLKQLLDQRQQEGLF